ncbi:MAG TPA: nuclease A inhibitor family protein [Polyangium sp.]|nr:nuclease A inhibitor family protein [Polyangium sp.]
MTLDATTLLNTIAETTQGVLFPSESDFPIETYTHGEEEPTAAALLERCGLAADSPVEESTLADTFSGLTEAEEDASEGTRFAAERFRKLIELLETNLEKIRAYRLGAVDLEVFVLGRHASGTWLGVRTKAVET